MPRVSKPRISRKNAERDAILKSTHLKSNATNFGFLHHGFDTHLQNQLPKTTIFIVAHAE